MKTITCDACSKSLVGEKTFYEVNQTEKTFAIFSESEGYVQKKVLKHMDICNECFQTLIGDTIAWHQGTIGQPQEKKE